MLRRKINKLALSLIIITIFILAIIILCYLHNVDKEPDIMEPQTDNEVKTIVEIKTNELIFENNSNIEVKQNECSAYNPMYTIKHYDNDIKDEIKNILKQKLINGLKPELIEWYANSNSIQLERKIYQDKNINTNKALYEMQKWARKNIHYNELLLTAFNNNDLDAASKLWLELEKNIPDKKYLSVYSLMFIKRSKENDTEYLHKVFDFLGAINAPIRAEYLIVYPASSKKTFNLIEKQYDIDFLEYNIVGHKSILETAVNTKNKPLFEYLLTKPHSKRKLQKSFELALKSLNINIEILEELWKHGARPSHHEIKLFDKLRTSYPNSLLVYKLNEFVNINNYEFPFDDDLIWQLDELDKEIQPLLQKIKINQFKKIKKCTILDSKQGLSFIKSIEDETYKYFRNGLTSNEIEMTLSNDSREKVELFRILFQKHFNFNNPKCFEVKNRKLVADKTGLTGCFGSSLIINMLGKRQATKKFIKLLKSTTPKNLSRFYLSNGAIKLILDNINLFLENGWDSNLVDAKNKSLFYYAVAFKSLEATKLLSQNSVHFDADPLGWDALDYFLFNIQKYNDLVKWTDFFVKLNWHLRDSHLKYLSMIQEDYPEEYAKIKNLINLSQ